MAFYSPYSIIEGLWKRNEKEKFLNSHLTNKEKTEYAILDKIILILLCIDVPLIGIAFYYNYYIWIPPFLAVIFSTIRQVYRRIKLQKYGFENHNKWYWIIFYIIKWIFVILFLIYNSYKMIFFIFMIL